MLSTLRRSVRFSLALFAVLSLVACGASTNHDPDPVVAEVQHTPITRSALNHWMATIVGGDYEESLNSQAPAGLVSDPPNYRSCVFAIESIGPAKAGSSPRAIPSELEGKCHQLYPALKQQALTFLISQVWLAQQDAEHKLTVTETEVNNRLEKVKAEQFPNDAAFAAYLTKRRWSLSDELTLVRKDLMTEKLEGLVEHSLAKTGATPKAIQLAIVNLYNDNVKKYTRLTNCLPGYISPDCSQYKAPAHEPSSPDVLLEQIAGSR